MKAWKTTGEMMEKIQQQDLEPVMFYGSLATQGKAGSAFTDVSIACPFFTEKLFDQGYYKDRLFKRNYKAIARWVLDRHSHYYMLVDDTIMAHNFRAFCNMDERKALESSLFVGDIIAAHCENISSYFGSSVGVLRIKDIETSQSYGTILQLERQVFEKNRAYQAALRSLTITSIPETFEKALENGCNDARALLSASTGYVVEEIAALLFMYSSGYGVSITKYPPLPPLKAIAGNHYPELSHLLEGKFGHVQLSKKGQLVQCDDEVIEVARAARIMGSLENIMGEEI